MAGSEGKNEKARIILGFISLIEIESLACALDFESYLEVCSQLYSLAWEYMLLTGRVYEPRMPDLPEPVASAHQRFLDTLSGELPIRGVIGQFYAETLAA